MDIKLNELRTEKYNLEQALARAVSPLLDDFQVHTGIAVTDVNVGLCDITQVGLCSATAVTGVRVRLDLCL